MAVGILKTRKGRDPLAGIHRHAFRKHARPDRRHRIPHRHSLDPRSFLEGTAADLRHEAGNGKVFRPRPLVGQGDDARALHREDVARRPVVRPQHHIAIGRIGKLHAAAIHRLPAREGPPLGADVLRPHEVRGLSGRHPKVHRRVEALDADHLEGGAHGAELRRGDDRRQRLEPRRQGKHRAQPVGARRHHHLGVARPLHREVVLRKPLLLQCGDGRLVKRERRLHRNLVIGVQVVHRHCRYRPLERHAAPVLHEHIRILLVDHDLEVSLRLDLVDDAQGARHATGRLRRAVKALVVQRRVDHIAAGIQRGLPAHRARGPREVRLRHLDILRPALAPVAHLEAPLPPDAGRVPHKADVAGSRAVELVEHQRLRRPVTRIDGERLPLARHDLVLAVDAVAGRLELPRALEQAVEREFLARLLHRHRRVVRPVAGELVDLDLRGQRVRPDRPRVLRRPYREAGARGTLRIRVAA